LAAGRPHSKRDVERLVRKHVVPFVDGVDMPRARALYNRAAVLRFGDSTHVFRRAEVHLFPEYGGTLLMVDWLIDVLYLPFGTCNELRGRLRDTWEIETPEDEAPVMASLRAAIDAEAGPTVDLLRDPDSVIANIEAVRRHSAETSAWVAEVVAYSQIAAGRLDEARDAIAFVLDRHGAIAPSYPIFEGRRQPEAWVHPFDASRAKRMREATDAVAAGPAAARAFVAALATRSRERWRLNER
jgi:hypothetical protein